MKDLNVLQFAEQGGVATVTLGPPIQVALIKDLEHICDYLEDTSNSSIVVFRGRKEGFSGPIDLREFNPGRPLDVHGFHRWEKVITRLERLERLTLAVLEGPCVGAGLHVALACDVRLASSEASFGLDEVSLGFLPGMATFRLSKFIGLGRARAMVLGGTRVAAAQALAWGLIDQVADAGELEATLQALISSAMPRSLVAHSLARRLLNESYAVQLEEFVGNFLAAQHRAITSDAFIAILKKVHKE